MDDEARTAVGDETADGEQGFLEKVIERARGTGVGTEDPNIVGDVGPTDVPPATDPDPEWPPPDTQ